MEKVQPFLDIVEDYLESLTKEILDTLETDLNAEKDGEGTKFRILLGEVKAKLASEKEVLKTYNETKHGELQSALKEIETFFETFRDTGADKDQAQKNMDRLVETVGQISILDLALLKKASELRNLVNDSLIKMRLGTSQDAAWRNFVSKIQPLNIMISGLFNERLSFQNEFAAIYTAEMNLGIAKIKKTLKKLEEIKKAFVFLEGFVKLLGKAAKLVL